MTAAATFDLRRWHSSLRLAGRIRGEQVDADPPSALDLLRVAVPLGREPEPWQLRVVGQTGKRDRVLLNVSRQGGKSTAAACMAVSAATRRERATVAIMAPTQRQSEWLHETARRILRAAGVPLVGARESATRLQLRSGARLLALPATEANVRGLADVDLLVFDEAARTPFSLYAACLPMLAASAGAVVALSTPNGKKGWWADAWFGADGDDWHREEVPWTECPHLDRETIEGHRLKFGDDVWVARVLLHLSRRGAVGVPGGRHRARAA